MDVRASSSSDSESLSEDVDSDDELVSDSGCLVGRGAGFCGVDCVDSSEDESSDEEEEPEDTARLLRFLFLLRAGGFGAGGPICRT